MAKVKMTVRQIMDLGLWEKVCSYKGWDCYILNEGRISEDEIVEFDSQFKNEGRKTKELSVNMHMYMECADSKTEEELREEFEELLLNFTQKHGLDYTIHETELQEV